MSILDYIVDLYKHPASYRKFWVALVSLVLSVLSTVIPDSPYLSLIIQFVGALGVFSIPNKKTV